MVVTKQRENLVTSVGTISCDRTYFIEVYENYNSIMCSPDL